VISISRSSTAASRYAGGGHGAAAPRAEHARCAQLGINTLAHRIDTAQELLALVARHEIGAFVPQVLGQVFVSVVAAALRLQ